MGFSRGHALVAEAVGGCAGGKMLDLHFHHLEVELPIELDVLLTQSPFGLAARRTGIEVEDFAEGVVAVCVVELWNYGSRNMSQSLDQGEGELWRTRQAPGRSQ